LGCTFEDRKKHTRVFYQGRESHMPRHPAKEMKKGAVQGILRQLGIKGV
jgi:mRNA interferase HicA